MTATPKPPKTIDAATELLARHAALEAELALIESNREAALAATNAVADTLATPIVAQLAVLRDQLEPWWAKNAAALTDGKRKSIELGGCTIGTKAGRAKLAFAHGDDKAAVAALQAQRWAKPFVRITAAVDKVATLKALDGTKGKQLAELGFWSKSEPEFFITRIGSDAARISAAPRA